MNKKDSAARQLLCAMTLQAIADYARAYDYISTHDIEEHELGVKTALNRIHEIEYFFLSEWFEFINPIPRIKGSEILELLHNGALKTNGRYISHICLHNEGEFKKRGD